MPDEKPPSQLPDPPDNPISNEVKVVPDLPWPSDLPSPEDPHSRVRRRSMRSIEGACPKPGRRTPRIGG